ncbi:MAG: hypothetical protein LAO07_10260 [Acidobacteriia bacterium]|nr:hypothetical protein [Terriglobia bacterium]
MRKNLTELTLIILALTCLAYPIQAATRLRVAAGTKLPVRLERSVGTKDFYKWRSFGPVRTVSGTLVQDIVAPDGQVALPAGTKISVAVLESKRAGHLIGRSKLRLGLYSVATPNGEVIPLDGYPTTLNHRKVDREGTARGHRGLVKDAAVDMASVTTGAGVGALVAGPIGAAVGVGAAVGGGGGLLIAAIWTVVRRGPDITVPAGTVVEFVVGRPVSFVPTGEVVDDGAKLQASRWGRGEVIPPADDLLAMADQLNTDPEGVLEQLKEIRFKERPAVDRTFAKYLEAMARYQQGDHGKDTLKLMREAYRESKTSPLTAPARAEMARNLVVMIRGIEPDWERDPLLNDPQVQAALVEELQ